MYKPEEMPVFIFNGFLDSGKTSLLKDILESDEYYQNYQTLVLLTEEGEEELSQEWIDKYHVFYEVCDDEEEFTKDYLQSLVDKYKPKQIFMEMNAFFDFDSLEFPEYFQIYQQVTSVDATKFEVYYNNMKQLINSMVKYSSIVLFNRCDDLDDKLPQFRRMIRAFNQQGQVAFERADGKMTTMLEEDLPFDLKQDEIVLKDEDYPIWYLDCFDSYEKYFGKKITFRAWVRDITPHTLVVGRQIMTCCEADIQFYGYELITDAFVKNNSFIEVTCNVIHEFSYVANEEVVMLKCLDLKVLPDEDEKYLAFN